MLLRQRQRLLTAKRNALVFNGKRNLATPVGPTIVIPNQGGPPSAPEPPSTQAAAKDTIAASPFKPAARAKESWAPSIPPSEREIAPDDPLRHHLIEWIKQHESTSTPLRTLLDQLHSQAGRRLSTTLPYESKGRPSSDSISSKRGIVTIAHVVADPEPQVVMSSGFAIADGSLIVTCAHTFHQVQSLSKETRIAATLAISHDGTIHPVSSIESSLPMSDIALLRIVTSPSIQPLPVDPYPAPIGTNVQAYNYKEARIEDSSAIVDALWEESVVSFYTGPTGQEAKTGTYDTLHSLLYNQPPLPGSSGGPIIHKDTGAVVGIIRGSRISYDDRKLRGFASPAESLFECFKIPGLPDGVD